MRRLRSWSRGVMLYLCVCVCAVVCVGARAQAPAVDTQQGRVLGVDEGDYMSFYDVPYGGPTADRRFEPPTPAPAFNEEINATDKSIICAQPTPDGIIGTEDCLVLSIHTNSLLARKPVLVWLESENYETTPAVRRSFKNLVAEGLLVVSLNHRLSIFGFLCLGVPEAPGNAGLLDVVLGLKWIHNNIVGFGGDPSNVVLLGHGSGAALADILTLSSTTDGLIHKAIILSGSALAPWAVAYNSTDKANVIGTKLGLSHASSELLAKALKNTTVETLSIALNDLDRDKIMPPFAPCVGDSQDILYDDPINILKSNNFKRIPYLTGYVKNEGTMKADEIVHGTWTKDVKRELADFLPPDINTESNKTSIRNEISVLYLTSYFNDPEEKQIKQVLQYFGDALQIMPILRSVQERIREAKFSEPKDYLFEFQYEGTNNNSKWGNLDFLLNGPNHGDILNYILDFDLIHKNETDLSGTASTSMRKRIAAFAYTGVPQPDEKYHYTGWPPVSNLDDFEYFITGGSVSTFYSESRERHQYKDRLGAWDRVYSRYYRPHRREFKKTEPTSLPSSADGGTCGVLVLLTSLLVNIDLM